MWPLKTRSTLYSSKRFSQQVKYFPPGTWSSSCLVEDPKKGRWAVTSNQGVLLLSTCDKSFLTKAYWGDPGEQSCSVDIWSQWTLDLSNEYQKYEFYLKDRCVPNTRNFNYTISNGQFGLGFCAHPMKMARGHFNFTIRFC